MVKIELTTDIVHYFQCNMCGACCKGSVELTPEEFEKIRSISKKLGIRVPIEVRDYIFTIKIIMKPVEDEQGERWCIFLKREKDKAICTIYEDRPTFCRLYPLYIGYSKENDTIYVDIVHCPNMKHVEVENFIKLDRENVQKIVHEIVEKNPQILDVVPDLDRTSVIFDLGDKAIITKLYKKYNIIREINRKLLNKLSFKCSILEFLENMFNIESSIRELSMKYMREGLKDFNIENIISQLFDKLSEYRYGKSDVINNMKVMTRDMGLAVDEDMYIIHDMISLKSKLVRIDVEDILNCRICELYPYIQELVDRFPIFNQVYYLPLEIFYTHGMIPIVVLVSIYYIALRSYRSSDEIYACIDMGGLPYIFKYVGTLVKLSYTSYSQDSWRRFVEI